MGLSILNLSPDSGTSRHRALALQRLGHRLVTIDPREAIPSSIFFGHWLNRTGGLFLGKAVRDSILRQISSAEFDIALVTGGALLDAKLVFQLKRQCNVIVNYNNDDPFGHRDGRKWCTYLDALPQYDLIVVVRDCNVEEAKRAGAKNVLRVRMSADEVAHRPRPLTEEDRLRWSSNVSFVGTWMPERGPFMARLVELGVPLAIYGDRWSKAKEWNLLRPYWRGVGLHNGEEYAKALQCSKVCLGLLSKGNRDLSTQRSFEIPKLGAVLCAERTPEHLELYKEDEEACFWSSPEECARKCERLLADSDYRHRVAENGQRRCLQNRTTNEAVMDHIIATALQSKEQYQDSLSMLR